ncbi:hypothetical protein [Singulisphaera sp. PoT]|uniref:hypothetical protein n=1 Tax=Singulisphaera sp. PoT TaxID=3411797 RepID=UPI003BF49C32
MTKTRNADKSPKAAASKATTTLESQAPPKVRHRTSGKAEAAPTAKGPSSNVTRTRRVHPSTGSGRPLSPAEAFVARAVIARWEAARSFVATHVGSPDGDDDFRRANELWVASAYDPTAYRQACKSEGIHAIGSEALQSYAAHRMDYSEGLPRVAWQVLTHAERDLVELLVVLDDERRMDDGEEVGIVVDGMKYTASQDEWCRGDVFARLAVDVMG